MEQTNLLDEITEDRIPADKGLRFVNLLVDTIVYYVLVFVLAMVMGSMDSQVSHDIERSLWINLYTIILFVLYFGILEGATNGKTFGKLITGTRAVKEDGSPITYKDSFLRSLSRLVPFEPFSAFGHRPWHDKWTDTVVVKENRR